MEERCIATYLVNKLHGFFSFDASNRANLLVVEQNTVELVGVNQHLWAESGGDELSSGR